MPVRDSLSGHLLMSLRLLYYAKRLTFCQVGVWFKREGLLKSNKEEARLGLKLGSKFQNRAAPR